MGYNIQSFSSALSGPFPAGKTAETPEEQLSVF